MKVNITYADFIGELERYISNIKYHADLEIQVDRDTLSLKMPIPLEDYIEVK